MDGMEVIVMSGLYEDITVIESGSTDCWQTAAGMVRTVIVTSVL